MAMLKCQILFFILYLNYITLQVICQIKFAFFETMCYFEITMTTGEALQKIAQYLEEDEKFVVLPLGEYEDLTMTSDPFFRQALLESEEDIKKGRLKPLNQVVKELNLE